MLIFSPSRKMRNCYFSSIFITSLSSTSYSSKTIMEGVVLSMSVCYLNATTRWEGSHFPQWKSSSASSDRRWPSRLTSPSCSPTDSSLQTPERGLSWDIDTPSSPLGLQLGFLGCLLWGFIEKWIELRMTCNHQPPSSLETSFQFECKKIFCLFYLFYQFDNYLFI